MNRREADELKEGLKHAHESTRDGLSPNYVTSVAVGNAFKSPTFSSLSTKMIVVTDQIRQKQDERRGRGKVITNTRVQDFYSLFHSIPPVSLSSTFLRTSVHPLFLFPSAVLHSMIRPRQDETIRSNSNIASKWGLSYYLCPQCCYHPRPHTSFPAC